jgi:hypothetical protein
MKLRQLCGWLFLGCSVATVNITAGRVAIAQQAAATSAKSSETTIKGYVIDSACTFTKHLKKPISPDCAIACAKAGSDLVIQTDAGMIYWPISGETPATGQNDKLMAYAGKMVSVTGKVYSKAGSKAIVIDKVEAAE